MMTTQKFLGLLAACSLMWVSCKKDPPEPDVVADLGGYPDAIGEIMVNTCAVAGCHDASNLMQNGRVSLNTWDGMMCGGEAGAVVIPYRSDESYLTFFINTHADLGPQQTPTMPFGGTPLSRDQVIAIQDWIDAGAPKDDGTIMWADNPGRGKIYVCNQGCDRVTVLDRDTRLAMRVVDVGKIPGFIESPHMLRLSPDGAYWYVIFLGNEVVEKYSSTTDQLVGTATIGSGQWNTFDISDDGQYLFAVDYSNAMVALVDAVNMTTLQTFSVGGNPHGSRLSPAFDALYITQQEGSDLTKLEFTDPENPDGITPVDLIQWAPLPGPGQLGPYDIHFTPDGSKYLVSCEYSGQVRVYQASNDSLLHVVTTGNNPVEIGIAATEGLAYVACLEDTTLSMGDPSRRGSVAIIDLNNFTLVDQVYTGFQPHGIAVDEAKGLVYVAHRNQAPIGPDPDHVSPCGTGRNGYVTAIEISTGQLLDGFYHEVGEDAYNVDVKF